MPLQREQLFKEALFRIIGIPSAELPCFRPVGGGSINRAYQVSTKDNNHWFCKFNGTRKFPPDPGVLVTAQNGLLDSAARNQFDRLYQRLPDIFSPGSPALLHGDLWSPTSIPCSFISTSLARPIYQTF